MKLRRQKVGFDFITFLSREASKALQDYIMYRAELEAEKKIKEHGKSEVIDVMKEDFWKLKS